jgi:dipeptidyl-peptidase-4
MLRSLLLVATLLPMSVTAAELTVERLFADPPLAGASPRALKVAPDGARVTFLRGSADDGNRMDLWEYHVASRTTRRLVDARDLGGAETLSDEEKARRERQRIAALTGIVEYQYSPDGQRLLFPLAGELYLYDLRKAGRDAVTRLTHGEGFATDPKVSPKGRYVSFVRAQDLYAIELASGRTARLTLDGGGTVSNATAEFVAQEEMGRNTGYWWAPDDSAIAFTRIDEQAVPIQRRFEVYADRTEVVEQRYPAAGDPNVEVRLGVVELAPPLFAAAASSPASARERPQPAPPPRHDWIDLGAARDIYLARVDWLPDARRLAYQRQSRDQRTLELVLYDRRDRTQRVLLTETSATWVNLHDDLRFLKRDDGFVWASERDGVKRLYRYDLDGRLRATISDVAWPIDALLALDERAGQVYVSAAGDHPRERQLWSFALAGGEPPRRLSRERGWHDAVFADNASVYVDTRSDPNTPPQVRLHRADGHELAVLEANAVVAGHPYFAYRDGHRAPEFGTIDDADGQRFHYRVVKPSGFDPGRRYPVVVRVYGGPRAQVVAENWDARWGLIDQLLARSGFVVFSLDNRGSARRGKAFEEPIFRRMGEVEVRDQLLGIDWLARQPWVDAKRIGVFGWSYGGYLTAMLLAQASDRIAAGVAVAPVTDWRLYDTHYTERYLDHPARNADGYVASSVFPYLDGFKSRLLLVHGMADDNVLFTHSTKLMAELQQRGVTFELMTYPGAKHGISGRPNQTHVFGTIVRFLGAALQQPVDAALRQDRLVPSG